MTTKEKRAEKPVFQKTDVPCLYRYSSNGVYYALLKTEGKQKKQSLRTTDKATAKRKLGDLRADIAKVDSSQGKITLRELCKRYLATIQGQAKATIEGKSLIVRRLLADFPAGPECPLSKIKQSDLQAWVSSYGFGYASYNHCVQALKAMFQMAVKDKAISVSPAAGMEGKKIVKPIRLTPTYEEFEAIVADVRSQKWAEAEESADFLEFMGRIGVGQAEASSIQKQHVNYQTNKLTFFRAKTRTPFQVPIFPKSEKTKALVKKLYDKAQKPTDLLFPTNMTKSKNGKGTETKEAKKALQAACTRLKLPNYTQRSLRRMFITRCIEKNIDVKVIAQWQGHSDGGKLILATYSHVRNAHADEMAQLLT